MSKPKKLYRSESDKMLAGVAGGLADYMSIDVTLVRLAFVLTALFWFFGFVIYVAMWIVVPTESDLKLSGQEAMNKNVEELKASAHQAGEKVKEKVDEIQGKDKAE